MTGAAWRMTDIGKWLMTRLLLRPIDARALPARWEVNVADVHPAKRALLAASIASSLLQGSHRKTATSCLWHLDAAGNVIVWVLGTNDTLDQAKSKWGWGSGSKSVLDVGFVKSDASITGQADGVKLAVLTLLQHDQGYAPTTMSTLVTPVRPDGMRFVPCLSPQHRTDVNRIDSKYRSIASHHTAAVAIERAACVERDGSIPPWAWQPADSVSAHLGARGRAARVRDAWRSFVSLRNEQRRLAAIDALTDLVPYDIAVQIVDHAYGPNRG